MTQTQKQQFYERLQSWKGKAFSYAGKNYILKNYKVDTLRERVTFITDSSEYEKKFENVDNFLDLWGQPITETTPPAVNGNSVPAVADKKSNLPETNTNQLPDFLQEYNESAKSLIDTLKETINSVKTNKDCIPQAAAIKGAVDSIINIERMKLEVYRTYKKEKLL